MMEIDEDASVYSGHYEVELVIDRPIDTVWTQFLNIPSWVKSHHIENVRGIPGTVGSITRVSFKKAVEMGMPPPHFHYCKLIKIIPEQQWLLKTYSGEGGSCGMERITAFDDGRVFALNDRRTRVTFNLYVELRGESVAKDPSPINLDISRDGMLRNLENLKSIVESR